MLDLALFEGVDAASAVPVLTVGVERGWEDVTGGIVRVVNPDWIIGFDVGVEGGESDDGDDEGDDEDDDEVVVELTLSSVVSVVSVEEVDTDVERVPTVIVTIEVELGAPSVDAVREDGISKEDVAESSAVENDPDI
ncbi:hypothetical protein PQX77_007002 [Marasmius sp. AFHP31]|nr:hypothetical protein PQX77_007002 [Marasmius sp. AFHP31]